MKKLFLYLSVIIVIISIQPSAKAQEDADTLLVKNNTSLLSQMMKTKNFVLKADYLHQNAGRSYTVQPNLNFVMVNDQRAMIQIGSNTGAGFNGLGGITIDGDVSGYDLDINDGNYNLKFTVESPGGFFDVFLDTSDPDNAEARVSTINGTRITFSGELVPPSSASITSGTTTY